MTQRLYEATRIRGLSVRDIRFPTSLRLDGSDAIHHDPDYSCAYVVLFTNAGLKGHGLTFTVGRGNELVVAAVKSLAHLVVGKELKDLLGHSMATIWRSLTSESQLRWVGPEKGVIHLAVAAIINALWDLWARQEQKPLWKLLVDMEPEDLVETIDFRYITDVLTKVEAVQMLKDMRKGKEEREAFMLSNGYPAYTTAAGWLGYSEEKVKTLCQQYMSQGYRHFKIKVGHNLEDDKKRCAAVRSVLGDEMTLMLDANQNWDVDEAIEWMKELACYRPHWIEEPTSPDDVLGHARIAKELSPLGIGVATGEMCQNRVMFKQFLQAKALTYCNIDAARVGGVSEVLSIYLMCKKFNVPVCPHAGGVGLCEMVHHLQVWDYISVTGTTEGRLVEFANILAEHFKTPAIIRNSHYMPHRTPGYSVEMHDKSLQAYEFPYGPAWKELYKQGGKYKDPATAKCPLLERPNQDTTR
uniref:Mitochondrial enolase superfamily member 1 n=1 Tax=Hirondellea gigas TaxID=1518452 RepID=A0A2P2I2Q3_9CRUS